MLYLSRDDMFKLLTHDMAIQACEECLKAEASNQVWSIPRIQYHLEQKDKSIFFMPSAGKGFVGLRVFTPGKGGGSIMYMLWDGQNGTPLAMMDAKAIRDIRTGAIGAIGAKYLARPDSKNVAVLGSGLVATSGLIAHSRLFKLANVKIYSPTREHREAAAKEMAARLKINVEPAESAEIALKNADIVITGASARHNGPVIQGKWYEPGMYISSMGARDELDDEAVTRAGKVVIDSKAEFEQQSKDVTDQVKKGLLTWDKVAELHHVVAGQAQARTTPDEITLMKTVGTPTQDLFPAISVYQKALAIGAGTQMGDLFPESKE